MANFGPESMHVDSHADTLHTDRTVALVLMAAIAVSAWQLTGHFVFSIPRYILVLALTLAPAFKLRWFTLFGVVVLLFSWSVRTIRMPLEQGIFFTIFFLTFVSASFRLSDLGLNGNSILPWRKPKTRNTEMPGHHHEKATESLSTITRINPLSSGLIWIPGALVFGIAVMMLIPIDYDVESRILIKPGGWRAICVLWFLVTIWFVAGGTLNFLGLRERNPERARMVLRSTFNRQLAGELHGIERRRARQIRRRARRAERRERKTTNSTLVP